jgi:hemerythrin
MLTWTEDFATGSDLVDLQHRRLIENINKLEALLLGPPPDKAVCDEMITFLDHYVNTHFKLEEMCMERFRCPAHEKNKQEHLEFQKVIAQFKQRYQTEGSRLELLHELQNAATKWIKNHILATDIQLKPCIAKAETVLTKTVSRTTAMRVAAPCF